MSQNKSKIRLVSIILATVALVFGVGSYFYTSQMQQDKEAASSGKEEYLERVHSPSTGPSNAPVTIVEFLDPECESCRAFSPFVKNILKAYPEDVRLVVRYLPFHKNSKFAVRILEAARKQGRFWEALDVLFKYQPDWGNHHNPRPELIWDILPQAGVNVKKVRETYEDPGVDEIIAIDIADAKVMEAKYTPTFFVNGRPLPSFGPDQLMELVREEIEAAKYK